MQKQNDNSNFSQREYELLIDRYNNGLANSLERAQVESWYISGDFRGKLFNADQMLKDQVRSRELLFKHMSPVKRKLPIYFIGTAAALVVAILCAWFFTFPLFIKDANQSAKNLNHIFPAKNGVTIKLSNGKTIKLSGEKNGIVINRMSLKYKDGSVIENQALEDYKESLEVSTGFGQSYDVTLPDGTNVFLNAATTIKFPSSFKNLSSRSVSLNGEAFFKVVHNSRQPFQVLSRGQVVEDIGTAFNINAYEDDPSVQTTLIEGSVKIKALFEGKAKDISEEVTLIPNERNTLTNVNPFLIERIEVADVIAWKDGDFQFNKEKMSNITKKLERWYNVKFSLSDQVANKVFTGKIARGRSLNSVLKLMERTNSIHFIIEGRRISVVEK